MTLQVSVLGPVTARVQGRSVDLGGPMPRGLVAVLALEHGEPVPAQRLVAALWGDEPPASARETLRAYLSRVRARIGAEAVERSPAGYRLLVDELDVDTFSRLVQEGRQALVEGAADRAVERLAAATGCWRGPALADLTHLPFAAAPAARLDEQRVQAVEDLLDARLRTGEHRAALGDLERLAAEQPLRERPAALLMLALQRSGRQADALAVYADLRRRLVEEVGIEPGQQIADLHHRILAQDPALALAVVADPAPVGVGVGSAEGSALQATSPQARTMRPLPIPLSSFVGRAEELATAEALRAAGRLVTLTGMGGCGKTRLALELARRAARTEEVHVAELAPIDQGADVAGAVAEALDVQVMSGEHPAGVLVEAIGARHLLLVLDNCEHLIAEAAELTEQLLRACPGLTVLATSREPLGVDGERVMVVPSLATAARGEAAGDAERLFAARAAQVDPQLALDAATAEVISRICSELDGIPLAIELAAARLAIVSLPELADLLGDRFGLLTSGSRTALPRHRTLEATVAWSYELLAPDERELFCAASVFRGGFDYAGLAAVVGRAGSLDVLGRLVAKSMLVVERAGSARRYRMLVTLREYAQRQLDAAQRRALADAHARWCAELLADAERHFRTPGARRAWSALTAEQHNLRAALQHALDTGQPELALALAGPLGFYWYRNGPIPEGLRQLEATLNLATAAPPRLRAKAHLTAGMMSFFVADRDGIVRHLQAAEEGIDVEADPGNSVLTLIYRGIYEAWFGTVAAAERQLARAEGLLDSAPDWARPELLLARAQIRRGLGDVAGGERLLLAAREQALALGHGWCAGQSGRLVAMERLATGRPGTAVGLLAEVIVEFAAEEDRVSLLSSLYAMAAVLAALGGSASGAVLIGAVEAIGERIGFAPTRHDLFDKGFRTAVAERLGPEDFEAAVARGRQLDLAAAVEHAVARAREAARDT